MKPIVTILLLTLLLQFQSETSVAQHQVIPTRINYFGNSFTFPDDSRLQIALNRPVDDNSIQLFFEAINKENYKPLITSLLNYRETYKLDDWLFYQLIRRTAQQLSPKSVDYERYTLYKWFMLVKCGYNVQLVFANEKLLLYVQSNENIYDIPLYEENGKQYVCLNIHDFGKIDFVQEPLRKVNLNVPEAVNAFSYKIKRLPDFKTAEYTEKKLIFHYKDKEVSYEIRENPEIVKLFTNYPSVDFESYFNIPLCKETYTSLIPVLKKKLKGRTQKAGIDYLMKFTRHAFIYETDQENFGVEKRLSPQQTLMQKSSDCDDRVGLLYYLVKEIYDLPMIVMVYPSHVTLAVQLKKPHGVPILYKGKNYSVCEPTPQRVELPIGSVSPELRDVAFQVQYAYDPLKK